MARPRISSQRARSQWQSGDTKLPARTALPTRRQPPRSMRSRPIATMSPSEAMGTQLADAPATSWERHAPNAEKTRQTHAEKSRARKRQACRARIRDSRRFSQLVFNKPFTKFHDHFDHHQSPRVSPLSTIRMPFGHHSRAAWGQITTRARPKRHAIG